ncbi:metal-dependent hydrolase [Arcobacter sp. 15-2]|uniref:metal-dependent hydrolase n=1 Tax=Arcobacter sp. 15-2 TaxID=3374109 RepID=UPI00399D427C
MASFAQHINTAVVVSGISIAPLYSASFIDLNQALVLLFFGMIGGVLPDIDLENSKPIQIASGILSIFIPLLAILTLLQSLSISKMLFIWFLSSLVLHFIIFKILLTNTIHRGVIHSIPMGIVFAQALIIFFHTFLEYEELFSLLCGLFLFGGFIIHLLLDELISLNAFGMSFKKSLGSAFKFYDSNNAIGSILLYILIGVLFTLFPLKIEHLLEIYHSFEHIKF